MKKLFIATITISLFMINAQAQGLQGLMNKVKSVKSNPTGSSNSSLGSGLSSGDIVSGLKDALRVGTDSTVNRLSKTDGFYGNPAIKILMPPEAQKAEKTLRSAGMGSLVDKAILSMNRAAEDASKGVGDIFWDAIKNMTVTDGLAILQGSDHAATDYLQKNTSAALTIKFRPIIDSSLQKVHAVEYWKDVFTAYNKVSFLNGGKSVNTDLVAYVTDKALSGLFYNIALEEQNIRKNPAAQVTDILKKVFGK